MPTTIVKRIESKHNIQDIELSTEVIDGSTERIRLTIKTYDEWKVIAISNAQLHALYSLIEEFHTELEAARNA